MSRSPRKPEPPDGKKSWTFGAEGDYAVDKSLRAPRIAALAVVAIWAGLAFHFRGFGYALRTVAFYMIPLACIWWPETMSRFRGFPRPFDPVDAPTPAGCLPWAAWFWLLIPAVVWLVARSLA